MKTVIIIKNKNVNMKRAEASRNREDKQQKQEKETTEIKVIKRREVKSWKTAIRSTESSNRKK